MHTLQTQGSFIDGDGVSRPSEGYGQVIDADDDADLSHLPTINGTKAELIDVLDTGLGNLHTATRAFDFLMGRVATEYGPPDERQTWDAIATKSPSLLEQVSGAEKKVRLAVQALRGRAAAIQQQTSRAPMAITASEEAEAAQRMPLLSALVESAPLGAVRDQIRHAIHTDDRAGQYVLATLIPSRLSRQSSNPLDSDPRLRGELQSMLVTIRAELRDRSMSDVHEKAGKALNAASAASQRAKIRERAMRQGFSDYEKRFGTLVPWKQEGE